MKKDAIDIWFDFANPPHVNLFKPIIKYYVCMGLKTYSSTKEFAETIGLLTKYNINYRSFGRHGGKNRLLKLLNLIRRNYLLFRNLPEFKLSISSSFEATQISWLKKRTSIIFDDNEIALNWLYAKFVNYVFSPSVIPVSLWEKHGINKSKVIQYDGFKENIYIADYLPDKDFLKKLPFDDFITVRPENIFASYVPKGVKSIVPDLLEALTLAGYNILYLPRYEIDKTYVKSQSNIFTPDNPLNGLDVCYYSNAVLTGAGTFAREAAVIGTPSISFFAGNDLLTVDKKMIEQNKIFHSRSVEEIINYIDHHPKQNKTLALDKSKQVKKEVLEKIDSILQNIQ